MIFSLRGFVPICLLTLSCLPTFVYGNTSKPPRKITINYPIRWVGSLLDSHISANVSTDVLTCFGNEEYAPPSYSQGFICLVHAYIPFEYDCNSIWGSRSVVLETIGSIEFFKLSKRPKYVHGNQSNLMKVTRWSDHLTLHQHIENREVKQIPAEPIYLCARSTSWQSGSEKPTPQLSKFNIHFRSGHIREIDKRHCTHNVLVHLLLLIAFSNAWLVPYIISPVVAIYVYLHGLKMFILSCSMSALVVCLAPIMLKAKNRHLAGHYLAYFLPGVKEEATIEVIRKRLPVFQAVFFSSAVVCMGSAFAYLLYTYVGIDREHRNIITRTSMGFASSWLTFFFCRSFERFLRDWIWVGLSIGLAQMLTNHLNPLCHDEAIVATIAVTCLIKAAIQRIAEFGVLDVRDTVDFLTSRSTEEYHHLKKSESSEIDEDEVRTSQLFIETVESIVGSSDFGDESTDVGLNLEHSTCDE